MQGTLQRDICIICHETIYIPSPRTEEKDETIEPNTSIKTQSTKQVNQQTNIVQPSASKNDENQQDEEDEEKGSLSPNSQNSIGINEEKLNPQKVFEDKI